mmetsp:Transcript_125794/g.350505  ORF Transcript_125794/g.350505 Transcript_125794/m.350505 type:complete len:349 (+) Transcript_125794:52-1098(+)
MLALARNGRPPCHRRHGGRSADHRMRGSCKRAAHTALVAFHVAVVLVLADAASPFVQGVVRAKPRHRALQRSVLPHGHSDSQDVSVSPDGTVHFHGHDVETIGRLRGLGRLLLVAGERLVDAASEVTGDAWLRKSFGGGTGCFYGCAASLRDAAVALVQERWGEADDLIGAARMQCGTFLPNEHLAALQGLLGDSRPLPEAGEALKALSSVLEVHAEGTSRTYSSLQDTLEEAAGALRAAARLFVAPRAERPPRARCTAPAPTAGRGRVSGRMGAIAAAATRAGVAPEVACEIEQSLDQALGGDMQGALRALARKYHPDRHPGRETEVLPTFLYVQQLREQDRWSGRA